MGGDLFFLKRDAVPEDNRFDIVVQLDAPANGLFAGLAGRKVPIKANLSGRGDWCKWDGALTAHLASEGIAALSITALQGTCALIVTPPSGHISAHLVLILVFSPDSTVDISVTFS